VTNEYRDIPKLERVVETPDKENAVLIARQNVNLRDDDADYAALSIANYIFGGDAGLDSRLMLRIRQKEGLSYGVQSDLAAGSLDRAGRLDRLGDRRPQNMGKVETAVREELARVIKDGLPRRRSRTPSPGSSRSAPRRVPRTAPGRAWASNLYLGRPSPSASSTRTR
jgi:zinc protease